MVQADPFYLDLSVQVGIVILLMLVSFAVFLFYRKNFQASGVLCVFIGMLLLYNDISWLISGVSFFVGFLLIFGGAGT